MTRRMINPLLLSGNNDENDLRKQRMAIDGYNSALKKTRPPVVGREIGRDVDGDQRYSSESTELQKYLKTLQQKAFSRKHETADDDILQISHSSAGSDNTLLRNKTSRFLKPRTTAVAEEVDVPVSTKSGVPSYVPFSSERISGALKKADAFASKYNPKQVTKAGVLAEEKSSSVTLGALSVKTPSPIADNHSDRDTFTRSNSSVSGNIDIATKHSHVAEKADTESLESFLNVKDLVDLASVSESSKQNTVASEQTAISEKDSSDSRSTDHESHSLQVKSVRELSDAVVQKYEDEERQHTSRTSSGVTNSKDYSDDFDLEITHSSSSVTSTVKEESTTKLKTYATDRTGKTKLKTKKPAKKDNLQIQSANDVKAYNAHKGTQTTEMQLGQHLLLINNLAMVNSSFPSYIDPCRVSTVTVSTDVLERLSSYKPSVLALDEMMRQLLNGSRSVIDSQRRNYIAAVHTLRPNYQYTTWETTLKYLKNHRKKQLLSHK